MLAQEKGITISFLYLRSLNRQFINLNFGNLVKNYYIEQPLSFWKDEKGSHNTSSLDSSLATLPENVRSGCRFNGPELSSWENAKEWASGDAGDQRLTVKVGVEL